ncbi:hypothetical protein QAD02_002768 [Eretmocerus hayati]|uniref:Uncharacterized protein n=1 Tax=Eretmocerus hayati TaxID=131215 RepID=A0ACC2NMG1_9HYME|nr:hypothetical protein QAD02_002768 [Eretmocerus hayati]
MGFQKEESQEYSAAQVGYETVEEESVGVFDRFRSQASHRGKNAPTSNRKTGAEDCTKGKTPSQEGGSPPQQTPKARRHEKAINGLRDERVYRKKRGTLPSVAA